MQTYIKIFRVGKFVLLTMVNVVTIVGEFVTPSGKVAISFGKVVSDTVKVINQLDTFATTTGEYKTRSAKIVASNRTKASTFAIHAKAPHRAKIAKELAFFPSRKDTFQQLERF